MANEPTMGEADTTDLPALKEPRAKVTVAVTAESESNFYVGFSENVSEGGVFVATDALMRIGTVVDLEITLPGQAPFGARGTVRWLQEDSEANGTVSGMGIRLDRLASADTNRIVEFATARAPMFFEIEAGSSERILSPWALVG
jgi:uncharacterized protein (TIGR02266 family)